MKVGLLIIGSELLQGKIQEANMHWLALFLRKHSLGLQTSTIVSDTPVEITNALDFLFKSCDVVVTSGGLGPTLDDITKKVLGDYFGSSMEYSPQAHEIADQNYQRYNREFSGKSHGYAYLPQHFVALSNPSGFAPGLYAVKNNKTLLSGPGVPKEFKEMISLHFPLLFKQRLPKAETFRLVNFRTYALPEEKIFTEIAPTLWDQLTIYGDVSSLPHAMNVDIGVKIEGSSKEDLDIKEKKIKNIIFATALTENLWNMGFENIEEVLVKILQEKKMTLALAESCTGGFCSHRLTNLSGVSEVFLGSVVSYDNKVKEEQLSVPKELMVKHGAVSIEVAESMARGARQNLHSDIAISITGIAGPGGGSEEKPVGTVCIGWSSEKNSGAKKFNFKGDREALKLRFSQAAFFTLWEKLK